MMDAPQCANLVCTVLSSDGVLPNSPDSLLARHEVLSHVIQGHENRSRELKVSVSSKETVGVKRQTTPDSIMTATWVKETSSAKRAKPAELDYGPVLAGEFLSAELAMRKAVADARKKDEEMPANRACQVCGLDRDRWVCRLPLYLNAREQPVKLPGSFCSKACFEHI